MPTTKARQKIEDYQMRLRRPDDAVRWIRDELKAEFWEKQNEIVRAVAAHRLVSVRTGHSIGKTHCVGGIVPWWLFTRNQSTVITTSASFSNVKRQLWPEIRKMMYKSRREGGVFARPEMQDIVKGVTPKGTEWRWGNDWIAFGLSTNEPERFGGYHAPGGILVVIDEASMVSQEIYDAIMTSGGHVLMIGNPLRPSGPFYDTFQSTEWFNLHVSSYESPNVVAGREVIPGLATKDWIEERKAEWGESSPAFIARALGQFPQSGEDLIVQLDWAEAARDKPVGARQGPLCMGVDIARFGSDRTTLYWRDDVAVRGSEIKEKQDTMQTAGLVKKRATDLGIRPEDIYIDDSGLGGGVTDRLHEQDFSVIPVNFGERASDPSRFANIKAELHWIVRERLEAGDFSLAGEKELANEVTWPRYSFNSRGQIVVEGKDSVKERFGRSPDRADGLMLSFAADVASYAGLEIGGIAGF